MKPAARGQTATAMARVLHLPAAGRPLLAGLRARSSAWHRLAGPRVTVADSDEVWTDPSLTTRRSYLNEVATGYNADVRQVPLLSDPAPPRARSTAPSPPAPVVTSLTCSRLIS
jgi:hypothetical protein